MDTYMITGKLLEVNKEDYLRLVKGDTSLASFAPTDFLAGYTKALSPAVALDIGMSFVYDTEHDLDEILSRETSWVLLNDEICIAVRSEISYTVCLGFKAIRVPADVIIELCEFM